MDNYAKAKRKVAWHIIAAPLLTLGVAAMGACGGAFFVSLASLALAFAVDYQLPHPQLIGLVFGALGGAFLGGRQALSNLGNAMNDVHATRPATASKNTPTGRSRLTVG
jgi:hypothetical protein